MKKNYLRRNRSNVFAFFIFILISYICIKYDVIDSKNIEGKVHLDILTINSIFAGFLFTSLGIMVGFADKKMIANRDKNGYMDKYYNSIYIGLLFLIVSIIFAVLGFVYPRFNNYSWYIIIEQLTLIGGIIYFIRSCVNILKIIQKIRNNI